MVKARTLITLAFGAAVGIGVWEGIPKARDCWIYPNIVNVTENAIDVGDGDSKSVTGHFEYDGQQISVESLVIDNGAIIEIPESMKQKDRFTFYAEDPEGHKTKTREYSKEVTWR